MHPNRDRQAQSPPVEAGRAAGELSYPEADVAVVHEVFSLGRVEDQSNEWPIVVTDPGRPVEVRVEGETRLPVPPSDSVAQVELTCSLEADPVPHEDARRKGGVRVRTHLTRHAYADRVTGCLLDARP